jgi:hypothetical protein
MTAEVNDSNRDFLLAVSRELGSSELLLTLVKEVEGDMTVSNAIKRFDLMKTAKCGIDDAIEFIASHFGEFAGSDLEVLSISELALILENSALKLSSEDALCEFILSLLEQDLSRFSLFEFVRFEYVSVEVLQRFCDFISEHFECLNVSVWSRLRNRLLIPVAIQPPTSRCPSLLFRPADGAPLNGIIAYLTRKYHGNVHTKGIVATTGHDCVSDHSSQAPSNAADLMLANYFHSKCEPNQALMYDFGDRRVTLSHYSIHSRYNAGENDYYLQSWVIECSVDGVSWVEVDRHDEDRTLNFRNPVHCFTVPHGESNTRFVRLRQTGPNQYSTPDHRLIISGFELFGALSE